MFLNSFNLRSVYKKINIFLLMRFKNLCIFICNYKKKYIFVEKGMLLLYWIFVNMVLSFRLNLFGGEVVFVIMKFIY